MSSPTKSRSKMPFDERNDQDFKDVTNRIRSALATIKSNGELKATEKSLAKLAQCSRGTLANRRWPIEELKEIKAARRSNAGATKREVTDNELAQRCQLLEGRLKCNRDELLVWKRKCDERDEQNRRLVHINSVLIKQKKQLEDLLNGSAKGRTGNVVSIRIKK